MNSQSADDVAADGQEVQTPVSERLRDADLATVAAAFAKVLDSTSSVAPDDDFFQLGGDSLMAASLMVEIEAEYGIRLSVSSLIGASTPRTLTSLLVAAGTSRRVGSPLIAAKVTGGGIPLFCVHGGSGESLFSRKISRILKGDRPVYGLRAMGFEANERPLATVPEMAAFYLSAVKQVQPIGPYFVLGMCAGSLVAYEIAQHLSAAGESIAGLILVDPPVGHRISPFLYNSGEALARQHRYWAWRAGQLQAMFTNNSWMTVELRRAGVMELLTAGVARYSPAPFHGRTLFVTAANKNETLFAAYSPLLSNCDFVHFEVEHTEIFTKQLGDLARRIDAFIDNWPHPV